MSLKSYATKMALRYLTKMSLRAPFLYRFNRNPYNQGAFLFVVLPGSDECTLNADCVDDSHLVFPKYVVLLVFTNIKWRLSSPSMLVVSFVFTNIKWRLSSPSMLSHLFSPTLYEDCLPPSMLSYLFSPTLNEDCHPQVSCLICFHQH